MRLGIIWFLFGLLWSSNSFAVTHCVILGTLGLDTGAIVGEVPCGENDSVTAVVIDSTDTRWVTWVANKFLAPSLAQNVASPSEKPGAIYQVVSWKNVNMQISGDQNIHVNPSRSGRFRITDAWLTNCSAQPTGAAGAVYNQSAQGGTNLVASMSFDNAQLSTPSGMLVLPFTAAVAQKTFALGNGIFLNLTTPSSVPSTCELDMMGVSLLQ